MDKKDVGCIVLSGVLLAPAVISFRYDFPDFPHNHQESKQPYVVRSQAVQLENVKSQMVSFSVDAFVTTQDEWSAT